MLIYVYNMRLQKSILLKKYTLYKYGERKIMFKNVGLNFNNFNQYSGTNSFMAAGQSFNMFSNPFMGGFNFSNDIASLGLFSGLNFGSYTNFLTPMQLPYQYMTNWSSPGLPVCPSIADAYNNFAGGGMYSMPFLMQSSSKPKFQFSVPSNVRSNISFSSSGSSSVGGSRVSSRVPSSASRSSKNLSADFVNKTKLVAFNLNCNYDDLLALMNSESGLNPKAQHGSSGAVGLIQFTGVAIQQMNKSYGLNLTKDKIKNMSAIEQLDLVEKYLKMSKKMALSDNARLSAADLYSLTFLPGRASRDTLTQKGEGYYASNSGLDLDRDGKITKSDLARRIDTKRVSLVA